MKIRYMSIMVTHTGISKKNREIECKKTSNGYIVYTESNFGGKTTRVTNDQILSPDSMHRPDMHNIIESYCWYFENDEIEAENILMNRIKDIAIKQAEVANKILSYLN